MGVIIPPESSMDAALTRSIMLWSLSGTALRMEMTTGSSRILGDQTGETTATLRCSGVMASAVLVAFVLLLSALILAMLLLLLLLLLHHQFLPVRFVMSVAHLDLTSPEAIQFAGVATPPV